MLTFLDPTPSSSPNRIIVSSNISSIMLVYVSIIYGDHLFYCPIIAHYMLNHCQLTSISYNKINIKYNFYFFIFSKY